MDSRRLAVALLVSAMVVVLAPFLRTLQRLAAGVLGEAYVPTLGAGFAVVVAAVLGWAVWRIRDHRWLRYAVLGSALLLMALQIFGWNRGDARTDAVERIHFVFYGLLAVLYYRTFRSRGGVAALVSTLLAVTTVGAVDEWLQWLVPVRTGDWFDVLLNAYAGLCGLLFALAVDPLRGNEWRVRPGAGRRLADSAAASLLVLAGFFHCAHLGYVHVDDELHVEFRSYFTLSELRALAQRRAQQWARRPPPPLGPLQIEDYYRTEAGWRVSYRNAARDAGMLAAAEREELILEKYYAPFLALGHALSPQEKARLGAASDPGDSQPYRSPADMGRIFVAPTKTQLWSLVALAVGALLLLPRLVRRG